MADLLQITIWKAFLPMKIFILIQIVYVRQKIVLHIEVQILLNTLTQCNIHKYYFFQKTSKF